MIRLLLLIAILAACMPSAPDLNNRANQYTQQGRYQEAIIAYQRAQLDNPDDPIPYFNAAQAYQALEQHDKALEALAQALKRAPAELHSIIYYNRGNIYFQLAEYALAVADYKQALLLDPNNNDARHNLELATMLAFAVTPTPIEMQVQPELGMVNPTMTPSPQPSGLAMPSPTPSPMPEASDPTLPEEIGISGEDMQNLPTTPVPFWEGQLTAEILEQIFHETEARQQNKGGLPMPTPMLPTPSQRKDW